MKPQTKIGAVIIGRNEGARLIHCLKSLQHEVAFMVYVDSGSTDDSLDTAKHFGAETVLLDTAVPFTAARARNAGFARLKDICAAVEFVQFVDGDCRVEKGYIASAARVLTHDPSLGLVTGWRAEIDPDASVFNQMCDVEWHGPAGDIIACGGDMMVRAAAFEEIGGFNPEVIAAEDDEFCIRLRQAGWRLRRLPLSMTHHDAHMVRFSQWWQRAVRTGHGFEQVNHMHPTYFVQERRRMWIYGGVLPALGVIGAVFFWPLLALVLALFAASYVRTALGLIKTGQPRLQAAHHAFYLFLSKFPNIVGALTYRRRRRTGAEMEIIEYK